MSQFERVTIDNYTESKTNHPLELSGWRVGQGIFLDGADYRPAAEEQHLAQSVDTEGATALATTVKERPSPVIKIRVVEPQDPAATNLCTDPQAVTFTAWHQSEEAIIVQEPVVDLAGIEYAALVNVTGASKGGGLEIGRGGGFRMPKANVNYTAGLWLKGANGGEKIELWLFEELAGTVVNITLTNTWKWYTVTRAWKTTLKSEVYALCRENGATFFASGCAIVEGSELAEYFDGTWPGCSWEGQQNASRSTRPAPGGPRRDAIMADVEVAVTRISKNRTGTVRRTLANGHQITFDAINAQMTWDEQQFMAAGTAAGTISFTSQPYGRSPEITTVEDNFVVGRPWNYTVDAGAWTNLSFAAATGLTAASNPTVEERLLYRLTTYSVEAEAAFITEASVTNIKCGVVVAWHDTENYVEAYVTDTGTESLLKIDQVLNGVRTNKASSKNPARLASTNFTVRARVQNDTIYAEFFNGTVSPTGVTATTNEATAVSYQSSKEPWAMIYPKLSGLVFTPQTTKNECVRLTIRPWMARVRSFVALEHRIAGVPGTAPALGQLTVENMTTNIQQWLVWGQAAQLASYPYSTTQRLFYEAEELTPINGSTEKTLAGASNGKAIEHTLHGTEPEGILSTQFTGGGAQLGHVGAYTVYARVQSGSGKTRFALSWSTGDFVEYTTNAYTAETTQTNKFQIVNLGQIYVPPSLRGTQQWRGQILAFGGFIEKLYIDCIFLVPVGMGAAEVVGNKQPTSFSELAAEAKFTGSLVFINGKTLTVGGSWESSGATTDYEEESTLASRKTATDTEPRYGICNLAGLTGVTVACTLNAKSNLEAEKTKRGILARWTNSSNYLIAYVERYSGERLFNGKKIFFSSHHIYLEKVVGGVKIFLEGGGALETVHRLELSVNTEGLFTLYHVTETGERTLLCSGTDAQLATGGALASGKCGMYDFNEGSASTRNYEQFTIMKTNSPSDAVLYGERDLVISSDHALRQDSLGTIWTPPSSYEGDYLKLPVLQENEVAVHVIKASRTVQPSNPDAGIDAIAVQLSVTPRWANVPAY